MPSPCTTTPLQLVGGPGTAKTSTVQQFLGRFPKDDHSSKTITFSYLTTPGIFQQAMEVRRRRRRCGGLVAVWTVCWAVWGGMFGWTD